MLSAIRLSNNSSVRASWARKEDGPFACPECGKEVTLHKGAVTAAHFTHQVIRECCFTAGETDAHRSTKIAIYRALLEHPGAENVRLEYPMGTVRADVYAVILGVQVAIEVQISTLSPEAISFRTREYARLGIAVLWLLQWTPELDSAEYSPRRFERWLHATYFGRVYFWRKGLEVLPYQFHDRHIHVERRTWEDDRGRTHRAGGYRKVSRRFKIAVCGKALHIVNDFRKTTRPPWQSDTLKLPSAHLFMDTRRRFERG